MSIGAQNVWNYLVKNNKAEKAQDGRYYYKSNQTTPEQKQQAQRQTPAVEEPGIDIDDVLFLKYSEITVENLLRIMPNITQEQLEFVVKDLRERVKSKNLGYDFTNLC